MMEDKEILNQENVDENEFTDRQILRRIDHTQLKPYATWSDIE